MNLFDDASLIVTPNGFKASKLYSLKPFDGSGDLTVVRNTSATRVNENGLIELVGNNVPRLDWSSGEPSILVEPQRTNLISNSNVFQGGFYNSVGRMTLNNNAGISPDGTNNAVEVVPTNENNAHYFRNGSSTYSNGNNYCYSMYFKNVNFENERIVLQVLSKQVFLEFDNNNVLSIQIGGSLPLSNAKLVDYGNGWYRVSIFWSESSGYKYTGVSTENDQDGTKSFLVYGSQLEEGSYPTSYIPTNGSAVTRNADVLTVAPPSGTTEIVETLEDITYYIGGNNLVTYSEDFSQWGEINATTTSNSATSPSGLLNADKVIASNSNSTHAIFIIPSVSASTTYTFSLYAKADEYERIYIRQGTGGNPCAAVYELSGSGSVLETYSSPIDTSINNVGNGWYRITLTNTTSPTAPNFAPNVIGIPNSGYSASDANVSFQGDGTSGIYIWGAQLEQGSTVTDYQATRDIVTIPATYQLPNGEISKVIMK